MSNEVPDREVRLRKVVSGGQTGVDRAALDAAMSHGIQTGGWCPNGRRAEDGRIDEQYPLRETPTADYAERTSWNVRDSDGTLVLARGDAAGGTAFTIDEAERLGRPYLVADPGTSQLEDVVHWLRRNDVQTLNVAGPRESEEEGIYRAAYVFLDKLLARR